MGGERLCSTHPIFESLHISRLKLRLMLLKLMRGLYLLKVLHRLHSSVYPSIIISGVTQRLGDPGRRLKQQRWRRGLHTQTNTWPLRHLSRSGMGGGQRLCSTGQDSRWPCRGQVGGERLCRDLSAIGGEWLRRTGFMGSRRVGQWGGGRPHGKGGTRGGSRGRGAVGRRRREASFGLFTGRQKRPIIL